VAARAQPGEARKRGGGERSGFLNSGGAALFGEWQQVVLVDFDTRPRRRRVLLQFMGA